MTTRYTHGRPLIRVAGAVCSEDHKPYKPGARRGHLPTIHFCLVPSHYSFSFLNLIILCSISVHINFRQKRLFGRKRQALPPFTTAYSISIILPGTLTVPQHCPGPKTHYLPVQWAASLWCSARLSCQEMKKKSEEKTSHGQNRQNYVHQSRGTFT